MLALLSSGPGNSLAAQRRDARMRFFHLRLPWRALMRHLCIQGVIFPVKLCAACSTSGEQFFELAMASTTFVSNSSSTKHEVIHTSALPRHGNSA